METRTTTRLLATVYENGEGLAYVVIDNGHGSHKEPLPTPRDAERRLTELREDGFAIADPDHVLDLWDVLTETALSVADLDADSAGYPEAFAPPAGRIQDAMTYGEIEVAYLRGQEEEL